MKLKNHPPIELSTDLIEAIRSFPPRREVEHCGSRFAVSPFDIYAVCPGCGTQLKVRALSAVPEMEDVFDAVFEWMNSSAGREAAARRQREIAEDSDE